MYPRFHNFFMYQVTNLSANESQASFMMWEEGCIHESISPVELNFDPPKQKWNSGSMEGLHHRLPFLWRCAQSDKASSGSTAEADGPVFLFVPPSSQFVLLLLY